MDYLIIIFLVSSLAFAFRLNYRISKSRKKEIYETDDINDLVHSSVKDEVDKQFEQLNQRINNVEKETLITKKVQNIEIKKMHSLGLKINSLETKLDKNINTIMKYKFNPEEISDDLDEQSPFNKYSEGRNTLGLPEIDIIEITNVLSKNAEPNQHKNYPLKIEAFINTEDQLYGQVTGRYITYGAKKNRRNCTSEAFS